MITTIQEQISPIHFHRNTTPSLSLFFLFHRSSSSCCCSGTPLMEALSSSCSSSSSKQFFVKKSTHRNRGGGGGFSPPWKTLFTTRTELGFFRFLKCKNADFSHSISLQLIKAIEPAAVSCPTTLFPSSEVAEEGDMMTTEVPTQEETYTGGKTVHVKFLLQKECTFGEQFLLVGDDPTFGMWNPSDAIPLDWSEGHIWSVELNIPVEKLIRFKFILKGTTEEELVWQPDPDRILQTWETKNTIIVSENWEIAEAQTIIEEEEPGANPIQELTADKISSELKDMSNPKEDLVVVDKPSNPKEILLIEDNMSCPKEELLVVDNMSHPKEELLIADNISNPSEKQTVGQNQDVVGSNSIAVTVDRSTSVDDDDEDDLVDYEGEPVLVPGLAPFPTTVPKGSLPAVVDTISTKDASVELNGNAIEVEDGTIPEKYTKKDLDENTHQENTTVTKKSDDGPEREKNVPEEELPLVQLEQTSFLELLRSDFHLANRRVRQLLKDLGLFSF